MAVRLQTAGDRLQCTTSVPNYNATYTIMSWVYLVATTGGFQDTYLLRDPTTVGYDNLTINSALGLEFYASGQVLHSGSTIGLTTWLHLAMVRASATSLTVYLNGAVDITSADNVGTTRAASTVLEMGGRADLANQSNARRAGLKMWDAALSLAEIQQEVQTLRPQRVANLNRWGPVWPGSGERTRDYSGNGHDCSEGGTLTDEDPPPVSYGAPLLRVHAPQTSPPQTNATGHRRAPYYVPARIY